MPVFVTVARLRAIIQRTLEAYEAQGVTDEFWIMAGAIARCVSQRATLASPTNEELAALASQLYNSGNPEATAALMRQCDEALNKPD